MSPNLPGRRLSKLSVSINFCAAHGGSPAAGVKARLPGRPFSGRQHRGARRVPRRVMGRGAGLTVFSLSPRTGL